MNKQNPARLCPRFSHCSVNRCPLEESYPNQIVLPDDKEKRCTIEKQVRVRISNQFPGLLKLGGLTSQEYAGKVAYEQKPLAVKNEMAQKGIERLRLFREQSK